jgi:F0F1-type ATP synthase assembly protein I
VTDRREEKESNGRRKGAVYQGGSEAVFSILITAGIGYWLDSRFETTPTFLLIGLAVGFAAFTVRLVRLGREMQRRAMNEAEETGESANESER